jgi:hypothetical protein
MRCLALCLLLLLAGCYNGYSAYPYYSTAMPPPPPPPGYGTPPTYGTAPAYSPANCGTPDQPKPCTR